MMAPNLANKIVAECFNSRFATAIFAMGDEAGGQELSGHKLK